jgi:hypothetical protein
LAVKMQGPRNLGEAYALAKIQEEYLATVKRSTRPTYEPSQAMAHGSNHKPDKGQLGLRTKVGIPNSLVQNPLCQCKG